MLTSRWAWDLREQWRELASSDWSLRKRTPISTFPRGINVNRKRRTHLRIRRRGALPWRDRSALLRNRLHWPWIGENGDKITIGGVKGGGNWTEDYFLLAEDENCAGWLGSAIGVHLQFCHFCLSEFLASDSIHTKIKSESGVAIRGWFVYEIL